MSLLILNKPSLCRNTNTSTLKIQLSADPHTKMSLLILNKPSLCRNTNTSTLKIQLSVDPHTKMSVPILNKLNLSSNTSWSVTTAFCSSVWNQPSLAQAGKTCNYQCTFWSLFFFFLHAGFDVKVTCMYCTTLHAPPPPNPPPPSQYSVYITCCCIHTNDSAAQD